MALVGLKATCVTPIVNVSGTGGGVGTGVSEGSPSFGTTGAGAFGGGDGAIITVYLLYSSNSFRKVSRSLYAFFSTMAHFTPSIKWNSSHE